MERDTQAYREAGTYTHGHREGRTGVDTHIHIGIATHTHMDVEETKAKRNIYTTLHISVERD